MSLLAVIRKLWHSIAPRTHSDVEEEFRSTLDAYQEDLISEGLPEEEARRKARLDLGRPSAQNENYRRAIGLRLFDELGGDIRYGLRGLRRNPGFAAVAVLSLALGIGATTAMFSLIYAVLLHPFPYADADRIVNLFGLSESAAGTSFSWLGLSKAELDDLGRAAPIDSVLGFNPTQMEITGALPEEIAGTYLTENAGTFFGVRPLLGRNLEPSDAENGGHSVVVLNYRFWQRHFGGDPHVIGQTLEINHAPYTIIGVMPRSFAFNDMTDVADVYLPATLMQHLPDVPIPQYLPWIKLRPHVTPAAAKAVLEPIVLQITKQKSFPGGLHFGVQPIIWAFRENIGHTLTLLLAGVVLLLIIGCANCSILLLARGRTRQHELAIRKAIGASRWRIIRQLLVEAIVISLTGAALGVAASYWLAKLPMVLSPDSFPAESFIRINAPILAFSVGLALLSGILFGLVPALRLSRGDSARMLPGRQTGVMAAPGKRHWSVLIAAQVALTLLLMATAGTAIRSFLGLMRTPLGYDPANVMRIGIQLRNRIPNEWERQSREAKVAYMEQIRQKIASVPGVSTLAVGVDAAPPHTGTDQSFEIGGTAGHEMPQARVVLVDPDYFATLRIPVLQGQIWNTDENNRGDFIAVVNHAFAVRYLSSSNATGQQLRIPGLTPHNPYQVASAQSAAWRQIIGVVGDARNDGLERPVVPAIYVPYTTVMRPYAQYFVRTQGDPLTYLQSIRAAIASVASGQTLSNSSFNGTLTLNEAIARDAQYSSQRLFSILFGVFSAMALALALVGIFSLVAYSVAQRTTEFGIRLALGAPRKHVLWVAARIALVSAAAGIAIGLALDSFLGAVLAHWMQNTFAAAGLFASAALLAISALLACLLPARHAVAVAPAEALRNE
ncbi:MAG TPA: ADOP family duplicated permease [Candidatus Angelobacter sp.]|jgi:predicted permease|nr:ADOP family duplicated permease [Candidatus Angelobacter sp.]